MWVAKNNIVPKWNQLKPKTNTMQSYPFQKVIINGDINFKSHRAFKKLSTKYGQENIVWHEDPKAGIDYLKNNLSKRTVVIIDYSYKSRQSGLDCLEQIKKISSLFCVIFYVTKMFEEIDQFDMLDIVNSDIQGLVFNNYPYSEVILLSKVDDSLNSMSNRVDVCLEEWIMSLDEDERAEKNIISRSTGKSWSLGDLLQEIRQRTPEGIEAEKNIITLSLDQINRGRRNLFPDHQNQITHVRPK